MLAEHLLLTGLPAVFATLLAVRLGLRSVPLLLAVALAASGCVAMLGFWAFYATPLLGESFSFLVVLGSLAGSAWIWFDGVDRGALRPLLSPLALWALASGFILYLGFLHGGSAEPLEMSWTRFSQQLPADNAIPRFFADWFYVHGHNGPPPPFADWLSSDRPPLQIGYVLYQRPFGGKGDLHYQVLGVVLQQLWVVGLWALLCAARLRPFVRGLAVSATLLTDVVIVHGFFVWPKLIAAAFMLAALAIVLSEDWPLWRRRPAVAALFAALCALAMLAHGSSVFFLVPLLVLGAIRGLPDWRWLGIAALVAVALLAPWSAYQKYADPPGDRLIKWQLGGSLEIDDRGSLETIVDGYREAGLGGTLENKWGNVTQLVGAGEVSKALREADESLGSGSVGGAIVALRFPRFFSLLPFLGFLLIGPLAMLFTRLRGRRPQSAEWRFAVTALVLAAGACLLWVLLMFGGPGSGTTIHVGSLVVPLLAACGCVVGAYACDCRLGVGLAALNALFVLVLFVPALSPPPGSSYSPIAALAAAAALAGFGWVALRSD